MYLSISTSTLDFSEMYLSTFRVLYKLYLSTDVLKYKVLLPGFACNGHFLRFVIIRVGCCQASCCSIGGICKGKRNTCTLCNFLGMRHLKFVVE